MGLSGAEIKLKAQLFNSELLPTGRQQKQANALY